MTMRLAACWLASVVVLSACGASSANDGRADGGRGDPELNFARAIAQHEVRAVEADIVSATFVVRNGTVTESNVGHPCTSGRLIEVKLIGHFPHIVTTGHPLEADQNEDFKVTAVMVTADAASGEPCLKGVQTGHVEPEPNAIDIPLG